MNLQQSMKMCLFFYLHVLYKENLCVQTFKTCIDFIWLDLAVQKNGLICLLVYGSVGYYIISETDESCI